MLPATISNCSGARSKTSCCTLEPIKEAMITVCSVGLTAVEGTVVACCYCWCRRAPGNAGTSRRYVTWIIIAAVVYVHCCCCFVPAVNIIAASRGFSARRCIMMRITHVRVLWSSHAFFCCTTARVSNYCCRQLHIISTSNMCCWC